MAPNRTPPVPESPWEVVVLLASWAVIVTLSSAIVRWDERRLARRDEDDVRLECAWPPASRDAALIGLALLGSPLFALLGVFWHFFRTRSRSVLLPWRWSLAGIGMGLGFAIGVLVANVAVVIGLALAFGLPLD